MKAGSKPASSSSTTKPVLMLHATTVSKPPTSTSAPPFSSRLQLLPFSSISTAFPTTANKQSGNKEQRNFQKREPAVKAVQSSHTEAPIPALIDQYFTRAEFRGFRYNPTNPFISEFNRLSIMMGWDKYPEVRKLRYLIFTEVLATQFNVYYGVDAGELKPWQDLCQALRLDPIPNTLKHARDVRLPYTSESLKATSTDLNMDLVCSHKTSLHH